MRNTNKTEVNYDDENDVLYIVTERGIEEEFIELAPNINVELGSEGQVVGVEIIEASKMLSPMVEKLKKAG